ncbi:MAG: cytochrome c oxidase subunit I, partial [Chloroflexi bacterium]|nr:cytochrome c oxidase subunit I [Chloroflexota bacterium]
MRRFFSLGLIRGLIATPVGVGIGMGLTMLARLLMGLPAWEVAPVSFSGAILGVVTFLAGVGAFNDWLGWARGEQAQAPSHPSADVPAWTRYFSFDPGHKIIGIQYGVTAILILFLAGLMALLIRMELLQPAMQFLTPDLYNSVTGIHGIVMIASILVGIAGMANYLVPLLVGAEDMVFPRLNALSFWLIPPAATLVLLSLFTGGFDTGWTGYPPLGVQAPLGAQFFYSGVFVLGLSS